MIDTFMSLSVTLISNDFDPLTFSCTKKFVLNFCSLNIRYIPNASAISFALVNIERLLEHMVLHLGVSL